MKTPRSQSKNRRPNRYSKTRRFGGSIGALLTCALLPSAAQAAAYTWTNGASDSTWNGVSADWTTGAGNIAWTDNNDVVFGATGAGAITVTGTQHILSLTTNAAGYSIAGGQVNLLNAATAFTINSDIFIGSAIGGAGGLSKSGTGTLTLTGSDNYSGTTTINAGTLIAGNAYALGPGGILTNGNATLQLNAVPLTGNNFTFPIGPIVFGVLVNTGTNANVSFGTMYLSHGNTLNVTAGAGAAGTPSVAFGATTVGYYNNSNSGTIAPVGTNVTLSSVQAVSGASGNFTATLILDGSSAGNRITGAMTDTINGSNTMKLAVTKQNTSTWTFSGSSSYSGGATISGGTLVAGNAYALGTGGVSFGGSGTLQLDAIPLTGNNFTMPGSSSATVCGIVVNTGTNASVNFGTLNLSRNNTLNVTAGAGATGTPTVAFGATAVGYYSTSYSTTIAPVGTNVILSSVQADAGGATGSTATFILDGSSGGNQITGAMTDWIVGGTTVKLAVTKQNTSTWTLSGPSTYSGATTVSGGVLALGASGTLGATALTVNGGGTLAVAQTGNSTTNALGGSLTMAAGCAFSMSDGYASTLTVAGAATLAPASGVSPVLTFDLANASADKLAITGAATVGAAGAKIVIAPSSGMTAGSYTVITAGSGLGSNFTLSTTVPSYYVGTGGVYGISLAGTGTTEIVTLTSNGLYWTGSLGSTWNTANNWNTSVAGGVVSGTAPGSTTDVAFGTTSPGNLTNTLGTDMTVNSVNFLPGSASVTVNPGNTLTIGGGGITNTSANTQTINAPIVLGTSQAWASTGAGSLTIGGTVTTGGYTLTLPAGNAMLSGPITGSGGLAKSGAGTVTLSGLSATAANNYSGATTLDGGTLAITTTSPSLSGGVAFGATGGSGNVSTLDLTNGSATFGGQLTVLTNSASANAISIGNGQTLTTNGNVIISTGVGYLASTPKLTVTGSGSWIVNKPGGCLSVGGTTTMSAANYDVATLDLSGLKTFSADMGSSGVIRVGESGDTGNAITNPDVLILAQNSTIKAGTLGVGDTTANYDAHSLKLGSGTQVIDANTINVGENGRGAGSLTFNGGSGSVTIRNYAGTGGAALSLTTQGQNNGTTSTFDLTGHQADLMFSSVTVESVAGGYATSHFATFSFDRGTLVNSGTFIIGSRSGGTNTDAMTATVNIGGTNNYTDTVSLGVVQMAQMSGSIGGIAGSLNITGSNTTVNIASLSLAGNTFVGGTATGALNINGGTVNLTGGGISIGGTVGAVNSAITLSNAVLNMQGHDIGSAGAAVGSFTFTSGTLQDLGTVYGPITLAGSNAHVFNSTLSSGTISGIVSGSGQSLTKTGTGTLSLTGVNTYTGATNVNQGRLVVSGSGALSASTTLSVASGASYFYQPATLGAQTIAGLTLNNGSTLGFSWNSAPANSSLSVAGAVTPAGGSVVYLAMAGTPLMGNAYTVLSGSAGSILNDASYLLLNPTAYTCSIAATGTSVSVAPSAATPLAAAYWTGNSTNGIAGVWVASDGSAASNWSATSGGAVQALIPSGVALTFPANPTVGATNTRLGADMSVASMAISDTTNGLSINADGSTLTITGSSGITMNAGVPASTIAASVVLGVSQTWTNSSSGLLTVSGPVNNGGNALSVAGSGSVTMSGVISGTGALTQNGPGVLTLAAIDSYTGATTIAGGTLAVGGAGQLGGGSYVSTISNAGAFVYASSAAQTLSGTIFGAGSLTQSGPGVLTLTGSNTYSGPTTITGGTLTVAGAGQLGGGSYANAISNAGAFVYSSSAAQTLSGAISGAGSLMQSGPGTLTISGSNSYTGNTVLAGGTTLLNSANALGSSGTISFTGGVLRFSGSNTADYSGRIAASTGIITIDANGQNIVFASPLAAANTGGLTLLGSGTLILSATNAFSGPVTVNAGLLQAAKVGSLPTYVTAGANVVGASGILAVNAGGSGEFSAGNIQTLLGNMTVTAGGLLGIDTSNAGGSFAYASPVSGNVGLLKLGAGTLILSGSSSNTGNMTINGGAVQLGGSGSATANPLGLGTVTVNSGATLDLAGYTLGNAKALMLSSTANLINSGTAVATYGASVTLTGNFANIGGTGDISITGTLGGGQTWFKIGPDTLTLTGSSANGSGSAAIDSGVLVVSSTYALGTAAVNFNGGTLSVSPNIAMTLAGNTRTSQNSTLTIGAGSTVTSAGFGDNGNVLTVTGSGNFAQSVAWTGTAGGGITFGPSFTGTATMSQANTSPGTLTVKSGVLSGTGNVGAFGTGTLVIGDTAGSANVTVQGDAHAFTNAITVPAGSSGTLTLQPAGAAAATFNGPVTLNNTLYVSSTGAGSMTLGGALSGSGSLISNGLTTLSNNSSLSGTVAVASGTLKTGAITVTGAVSTSAGAIFDIAGNAVSVGGLLGSGTVTNSGAAKTLTLAGSGTYACAGAITAATAANMALTVALGSGGVQTLSGSNSYSGGTTINAGTLAAGNAYALGTGGILTNGNATLQLNAVPLTGNNFTFPIGPIVFGVLVNTGTNANVSFGTMYLSRGNTLNVNAGAGAAGTPSVAFGATTVGYYNNSNSGTIAPVGTNVTLGSVQAVSGASGNFTATLILDGSSTGNQITGAMTDTISGTNTMRLAVTKQNTSTWTLSGSSSYSGGATIGGGTLVAGNAYALGTGGVSFGGAGTLQLDAVPLTGNNFTLPGSASATALGIVVNTGTNASVNFGTLNLSRNNTLNVTAGAGTAGTPAVAFGATTVGYASTSYSATIAPVGTNVILSSVQADAGFNGSTATLIMDGSSGGNQITGAMTDTTTSGSNTVKLAVTKQNTSTWTLSGASTYTGATTVSGGVLALGAGGTLGATALTVNGGGTLAVAQTGNSTTNALGGSLTMAAGSAFSMSDGYASTLTVAGAATLAPASGVSPVLTFDLANASADKLAITGSATVGAAGAKIVIAPASGMTAGSYTVITAGSGLGSNFTLSTTVPSYYVGTGGVYGISLAGTGTTEIVTLTSNGLYWTGSSGSAWNTAGNWNTSVAGVVVSGTAPVTTTDIAFGTTNPGNLANTLGVSTTVNSVNFLPASASVTVNPDGNTLTIGGGGITNTSANAQTINAPIVLGTFQTWTNTGAGLLTIGGVVSGSGGITKSGAGTVTFTGLSATAANNYSGATTLDGGTLAITTTNPSLSGGLAFGATGGSGNVSTLDLTNGSATFGGQLTVLTNSAGANAISIGNGQTLTTNGNVIISTGVGYLASTPILTVTGSGSWIVNKPGGCLSVGGTTTMSAANYDVATLDLSGLKTFSADMGSSGVIRVGESGDSGNAITNPDVLILAQNSTIKAGTLGVGDTTANYDAHSLKLGSGTQVIDANTINVGENFRGSGSLTFNGGSGSVTIRNYAGTGGAALSLTTQGGNNGTTSTFDLTGHQADLMFSSVTVESVAGGYGNTHTAIFSFDQGTLTNSGTFTIGKGAGSGSSDLVTATVNIGGTSNYTDTASLGVVQMAQISSTYGRITGTLNITGSNTTVNIASLSLAGNPAVGGTASGALNITGGTVNLTGGGITIGATTGAVNSSIALSNAVLNMQGHNIGSASASIGSFTFTSGTLQDVGTVYGPITLAGGNAHIVNSTAGSGTIAGIVSGSGQTLAKTGAGTLLLAGSNSYSGGTIVSGGSLQLGNANALGTGGLTVNGGTVDLNGNSTSLGALGGSGGTVTNTVSGTATLTTAVSGTLAYAGNILNGAGGVNLVKSGSGTLILSGSIGMSGLSAGAGQVTLMQSGSIAALNVYTGATVALAANTGGTRTVLSLSALAIGGTFSGMAAPAQPSAAQLNADILGGAANTATLSAAAQSTIEPAAPEAVPEPGTLGLLLAGALGLLGIRRKANIRVKG